MNHHHATTRPKRTQRSRMAIQLALLALFSLALPNLYGQQLLKQPALPSLLNEAGELFIAIASGLEEKIPNQLSQRVDDGILLPQFQKNMYRVGLFDAAETLAKLDAGEPTMLAEEQTLAYILIKVAVGGFLTILALVFLIIMVINYRYRRRAALIQKRIPHVSRDYYTAVEEAAMQLLNSAKRISIGVASKEALQHVTNVPKVADVGTLFFLHDVLLSFRVVGCKIDLETAEGLGVFYLMWLLYGGRKLEYSQLEELYAHEPFYAAVLDLATTIQPLNPEEKDKPLLGIYFEKKNSSHFFLYKVALSRFFAVVGKVPGDLLQSVDKELVNETFSPSLPPETAPEDERTKPNVTQGKKLEEILGELKDLVGLQNLKDEITSLVNLIKIQQERRSAGLLGSRLSYHFVFMGNPGTGKATVAQLLADLYHCLGLLPTPKLLKTDCSGMIAEYIGQTEIKTNALVDSALDGVLYIDEERSLASLSKSSYGKEAFATLTKRMYSSIDCLVVILAGGTQDMQEFLAQHEEMSSLFTRQIIFSDYTPEELLQILEKMVKKHGYTLDIFAKTKLLALFSQAYSLRDKSFGNARLVDSVFEKMLEKQAVRLASQSNLAKGMLTKLNEEDIPESL